MPYGGDYWKDNFPCRPAYAGLFLVELSDNFNVMKHYLLTGLLLIAIIGVGWWTGEKIQTQSMISVGSVGDEPYTATTTGDSVDLASNFNQVLKSEFGGVLGSVVITAANTGTLIFYDATTTDSTLRDGSQATTTITIAQFNASPTVGTYTFDMVVNRGLIVQAIGTAPTTTITYK